MKKRSIFYRFRRKMQVFGNKRTSYEFMSKVYYFVKFKKRLNLNSPLTLSEKLQWLKLNYYPYNEDVINCTDKYAVREYIHKKGQAKYLNKLLGVWDKWEDINWDDLPNQFALKCNHGCGYNIISRNKNELDKNVVEKSIKGWMNEDFSLFNAEKHYSMIPRKIICEEYLGEDIIDYKFFCFHGKPHFFYVAQGFGQGVNEKMTFFNIDGTKADFTRTEYQDLSGDVELPERLDEMIEISKVLSSDFPFVRVDFFEINGQIVFSEMTFTPGGGLMKFSPEEYDQKLGELLNLDLVKN